jgi:hypothetical protein
VATELQVWQSVEQSYLNLGEAEERIGAAGKAVESAEENYQLAGAPDAASPTSSSPTPSSPSQAVHRGVGA